MAGIYVHIPFCRQACHYCDFYFSTTTRLMEPMVEAITAELILRKAELENQEVTTLYIGGGTPSLLPTPLFKSLVKSIGDAVKLSGDFEFTVEANPDDLSQEKLFELKMLGVNRLSIGLQSFDDATLKWMNRAHSAHESLTCVKLARDAGFDALSIDLIYGLPKLTDAQWKSEIATATGLGVTHISAYCLTVEPGTALGKRVKTGKENPVDEDAAARQFYILVEALASAGFEQYEVSNFARNGSYSKHNTSYWQGTPYLGIGPSAHSLIGKKRSWNIANNALYIQSMAEGKVARTEETLSANDQINEALMTGLRTKWGVDLALIREKYHVDIYELHKSFIDLLIAEESAIRNGGYLKLNSKGLLNADGIASTLFLVKD